MRGEKWQHSHGRLRDADVVPGWPSDRLHHCGWSAVELYG